MKHFAEQTQTQRWLVKHPFAKDGSQGGSLCAQNSSRQQFESALLQMLMLKLMLTIMFILDVQLRALWVHNPSA